MHDMPEHPSTLAGEALARLMEERGWTRREVASAAGIDYKTVGRWLNGDVVPHVTSLATALMRAGVNPADYGVHSPLIDGMTPATPTGKEHTREEFEAAIDTLNQVLDNVRHMPELADAISSLAGRLDDLERFLENTCPPSSADSQH